MLIRLVASLFSNAALAVFFMVGGIAALVRIYGAELPSYEELRNYQPKMLSRVYSGEGQIIAEFARERRIFVPIDEVPPVVIDAFLSAEDKNFYSHPGVDIRGIIREISAFTKARLSGQSRRLAGASTITQQVMKNFLVGDDRTFERKIKEAILAVRVEASMSKDTILELYLNDIYLGARSHGVVAAAENYFDKTLEELLPHEAAYLAALPKAPSTLHPVNNYERAMGRRNYVLGQMYRNGAIDQATYDQVVALPLETELNLNRPALIQRTRPTYFAEEVRRQLISEVGERQLYRGGLAVRATIDDELQAIAVKALRRGLERYDRGRGLYRGPIGTIPEIANGEVGLWRELLPAVDVPSDIEEWNVAVVLEVVGQSAIVGALGTDEAAEGKAPGEVRLTWARERQWISRAGEDQIRPRGMNQVLARGDVVFVMREEDGWSLRQTPGVQGAFMAMDPHSGRVLALQGGFSYDHSAFNRATQAQRQPGSSFKPFIYAAALDVGYSPDTIVLDAPIVVGEGRQVWRPKNSSGDFSGPLPLQRGLELSKNLMTVRIAQAVGMDRVGIYAERFGVYNDMPEHLSFALGAGETTLYQMVAAYGMFANGGRRVVPTLIDRIQDRHGKTLYSHDPRYCQGCDTDEFGPDRQPILFDQRSQIMDPTTAYQLVAMMEGVVSRGTANRTVGGLGFPVAGKTGTTNDAKDAWFIGFTANMVAGCFIGFDQPTPMGRGAYGGTLCGPVFREFMAEAMKTRSPGRFRAPAGSGVVTIKVHRDTGERLPDDAEGPHVMVEVYETGVEAEIASCRSNCLALADDSELFGAYGSDLPYILPEGDDTPIGDTGGEGGGGTGIGGGTIGLGTGGVY
ncbi:MAG: PBP1A family penicillin-binding protein [Pseudomonadota bacterium]